MLETGKRFVKYLDCFSAYYSIQLGRCVLFSFVALLFILILRQTFFKNRIFLKGFSWMLLLVVPCMGRLKLFYENEWMIRLFWWWNSACMRFAWVRYGYLAGLFVTAGLIFYRRRCVKTVVSHMKETCLNGQKVRLADFSVTPFATGLIRSRIVLPEIMRKAFSSEELRLICLHEQTHIRLGHLWFYFLWDIGRSLLWMNPFLAVCTRVMREDLEDICDAVTIQKSGRTAREYGKLLLKSMSLLQTEPLNPGAAFAGTKDYQRAKNRFTRISRFRFCPKGKIFAVCAGAVMAFALLFCLIYRNSYPNYTEYEEILILSEENTYVEINNPRTLAQAVQIEEDEVVVDVRAVQRILNEQGTNLASYYIVFGGYMKLPGIGGGGNAVYVSGEENDGKCRISYHNNDKEFITCLFKWI